MHRIAIRFWYWWYATEKGWLDDAWERDVALAPSSTRRLIIGKILAGALFYWTYYSTSNVHDAALEHWRAIEERWDVDAALEHWRMTH